MRVSSSTTKIDLPSLFGQFRDLGKCLETTALETTAKKGQPNIRVEVIAEVPEDAPIGQIKQAPDEDKRTNILLEDSEQKKLRELELQLAEPIADAFVSELKRLNELAEKHKGVKYKTLEGQVNGDSQQAQDLRDVIAVKKGEISLIPSHKSRTTSEKFLNFLSYVCNKYNVLDVLQDEEVLALIAYTLVKTQKRFTAFPDGFLDETTEKRLYALTKHYVLEIARGKGEKNLSTARDLETYRNWSAGLDEAGVGILTKCKSLPELLAGAFPAMFEGDDPAVRDWLLFYAEKWQGDKVARKACAWFLEHGVKVVDCKGGKKSFNIEKMKTINWMTELDKHGLRKMTELCNATSDAVAVIALGAEELGLPNPVGINNDQLFPWLVTRNGMYKSTKDGRMLIDDITDRLFIEHEKRFLDREGNLKTDEVKKVTDWYTLYESIAKDGLRRSKLKAHEAIERKFPFSFGYGRDQLRSSHFRFDNMWRGEDGKKRFLHALLLDGICYGGDKDKTVGTLNLTQEPPTYVLHPNEFKEWYEATVENSHPGFAAYLTSRGLAGGLAEAGQGKLQNLAVALFKVEPKDLPAFDASTRFYFKNLVLDLFRRQNNKPLIIELDPVSELKQKAAVAIADEVFLWTKAFVFSTSCDLPTLRARKERTEALQSAFKRKSQEQPQGNHKIYETTIEAYERAIQILRREVDGKLLTALSPTQGSTEKLIAAIEPALNLKGASLDPVIIELVVKDLEVRNKS